MVHVLSVTHIPELMLMEENVLDLIVVIELRNSFQTPPSSSVQNTLEQLQNVSLALQTHAH